MINLHNIPSDKWVEAKTLVNEFGMSYADLKSAAKFGGVLDRKVTEKPRKVLYRSKNLRLL